MAFSNELRRVRRVIWRRENSPFELIGGKWPALVDPL
jgi:hypothetical protein